MGIPNKDLIAQLNLPPGFRFYPTDEELLVQYLCRKVAGHHFSLQIIADIDLYKFDPWVLPSKAMFGEKEWYFFTPLDRKYPNGSRPNRVAGSGYWKATGTDKAIASQGRKVGIKKSLVFYIGKAPKGTKTNWIMHEYRLSDSPRNSTPSKLDDWVLCRIYKKSTSAEKSMAMAASNDQLSTGWSSSSTTSSPLDDVMDSLPEINDRCFALPRMNSQEDQKPGLQSWFGSGNFDWSVLARLTAGPVTGPIGVSLAQGQQVGNHDGGDLCVPCLPPLCCLEEEAQSDLRNQRVGAAPGVFYSDAGDPFGIRYVGSNPVAGFGFRQ